MGRPNCHLQFNTGKKTLNRRRFFNQPQCILLGLFYGFIHAMRLCATSCTLYTGGVSAANELMLLHLLLYREEEEEKEGLRKEVSPSEGIINPFGGSRIAPNDLLNKLLTGTLVVFELCLPSASSAEASLPSESDFSTSSPTQVKTQASPISSTKDGKDQEEMRCVAFRSLCNLSDCDSADALGNLFVNTYHPNTHHAAIITRASDFF